MISLPHITGVILQLWSFLIPSAHAQGIISNTADYVGQGLARFFGSGEHPYIGLALFIIEKVQLIVPYIALYFVVRASFTLAQSEDEGKLETAKQRIIAVLVGTMLIYLSTQLFRGFYAAGGLDGIMDEPAVGFAIIQGEVEGIIQWALVVLAALGVFLIVLSCLNLLFSFGKEDAGTKVKQTLIGIATGVIVISLRPAILLLFNLYDTRCNYDPYNPQHCVTITPEPLIAAAAHIILGLLGFLVLVAVLIIIYAGIMMIFSFGTEERFTANRSLIIRALIGLAVIILAYVITQFIVGFVTP